MCLLMVKKYHTINRNLEIWKFGERLNSSHYNWQAHILVNAQNFVAFKNSYICMLPFATCRVRIRNWLAIH